MWLIKNVLGDGLLAKLIASSRFKDVGEFKEWEAHKDAYVCEFYEKVVPRLTRTMSLPADSWHRFGKLMDLMVSSRRLSPYPPSPTSKPGRMMFNVLAAEVFQVHVDSCL